MSASLSNAGLILQLRDIPIKALTSLKRNLKVTKESSFGNFLPETFAVYILTPTTIHVPLYYYLDSNLINSLELSNLFCKPVPLPNLEHHTITPRTNQLACIDACIKELDKDYGGGIINLTTGSGKTIVSLYLIAKKKLKTLIIVNKRELIEQWKRQILQFIPHAKIGLIQGKTFDIEDKDIVIGMLHTITLKDHLVASDFKWIDLCIIDEVHNLASSQFSKCLFKVRSRYVLGLTATIERQDKLEKVFMWHLGKVLFSNTGDKKQSTNIYAYSYSGESSKSILLRDDITPNVSVMITNIANDLARNNLLYTILERYIKDDNRCILFMSDRISQLKWLYSKLGSSISGLYIGSCKAEELLHTRQNKQVILATYKIANEGFDCPRLNMLVLGTPRKSIIQTIGRIYRKTHVITPVIIDVIDEFSIFKNQWYARKRLYKEHISDCSFYIDNHHETLHKETLVECMFESDTE
jgi:superfamily II DNA or RNA helicase